MIPSALEELLVYGSCRSVMWAHIRPGSTDMRKLDFDISLVWDRVQSPSVREDGTVPDQNDFRMIFEHLF